jgi:predicted nuclease of predicted toxin-antitoxin system
VKFLLNMNIPREFGPMLAVEGHQWRHSGDIGLARATDTVILATAERHRECVITHDLDYGQLLAFSGDRAPSVVLFRLRRAHPRLMFERLKAVWSEIEGHLADGAVVTIEEAASRVRRLPISREN